MLEQNLDEILNKNMLQYSHYVVTNRALPDIKDGLKPAARNILITMHNMKLNEFTKSQNVVGQVMQIHPHGDCYDTIVGMVQKDNNLTPLIDGKGSFGYYTSKELQPAAARYTEIKLSNIAKTLFDEINLNVVDYIPTYDDKSYIPSILPSKFPAILHYCQSGIAVGMNSSIPSYNLIELNQCVIKYLTRGEIDVLTPDFATGGLIDQNDIMLKKIYETGEGSLKLRAKIEIKDATLKITEIPYTTTREAVMESIINCAKTKKITQISGVKDLTGLDGMLIEITAKTKTNMNELIDQLYALTPLESTFVVKINVLNDGIPMVMGVKDIIKTWVEWRQQCIIKRIKSQLDILDDKLHKISLNCLIKKYQSAILKVLENSLNEDEVIKKLMIQCNLTYNEAEYVANFKLKHFNQLHISEQEKEKNDIIKDINQLQSTLNNIHKINKIIIEELREINEKFGTKRKTMIQKFGYTKPINPNNFYWNVIITKDGYVKKLKNNTTKYLMKDGDEILYQRDMQNDDEILAYHKDNIIYKIKIKDIKECKGDMGVYLSSDRQYDFLIPLTKSTQYIINIYKERVAKINVDAYRISRKILKPAVLDYEKLIDVIAFDHREFTCPIKHHLKRKNKPFTFNAKNLKDYQKRDAKGINIKNLKKQ